MPAAALSATVGLVPVAMGAGIAMKVTERILQGPRAAPRRTRRSRKTRRTSSVGFGNFSNIGF